MPAAASAARQRELTEEPDGERDGADAVDVLVPRVHRGIMP